MSDFIEKRGGNRECGFSCRTRSWRGRHGAEGGKEKNARSGMPADLVRVLAGTRTCIVLSCVEALYWFLAFSRARYVANGAFEPVVGKEQIEDFGL